MTIKIEKNVPIPRPCAGRQRADLYPFDQMSPGDSFAMKIENANEMRRTRSRLYSYAVRKGFKIAMREWQGELRVWRVA